MGKIQNLKISEKKALSSLLRKKIIGEVLISKEFLKSLSLVHDLLKRNLNLVINHRGKVDQIFIGGIWELETHLNSKFNVKNGPSNKRLVSITDRKNEFEKKDKVTLINSKFRNFLLIKREGNDRNIFSLCHKNISNTTSLWSINNFNDLNKLNEEMMWGMDTEGKDSSSRLILNNSELEKVYLVIVSTKSKKELENSLSELTELCTSLRKEVVGYKTQLRKSYNPTTLIGKGALSEVLLESKYHDVSSIIFNQELLPLQSKEISKLTSIKISDRTEIILKIFQKNAQSKEAHTQIELAQLKYELPRLAGRGKQFSQIAGGIGSKGPGEKKIEQRKRYIRKRINIIEKQINKLSQRRFRNRSNRDKNQLLAATLIGYTCAGKSTLFNRLTKSKVTESTKPFSTLNPITRRTYLSNNTEILLTDTVGFISNLPEDLISSFRATLEEINASDILIHVADASDPDLEDRIFSVEETLLKTKLIDHPRILVLNKIDLLTPNQRKMLEIKYRQPMVSSSNSYGISNLREFIEQFIFNNSEKSHVASI